MFNITYTTKYNPFAYSCSANANKRIRIATVKTLEAAAALVAEMTAAGHTVKRICDNCGRAVKL
jgi:hypothetical protein